MPTSFHCGILLLLVNARGESSFISKDADNNDKTANYAAKLCDNYSVTKDGFTYSDWFLPSKLELNEILDKIHAKKTMVLSPKMYWSSTESGTDQAFMSNFYYEYHTDPVGKSRYETLYVRAVRAF